MKEIYFHISTSSLHHLQSTDVIFLGYKETEEAIINKVKSFHTTSIAHLSFDLIKMGYKIYLCYNEKRLEIKPGMDLCCGKELRLGHNISKLFMGHVFDDDLELSYGYWPSY